MQNQNIDPNTVFLLENWRMSSYPPYSAQCEVLLIFSAILSKSILTRGELFLPSDTLALKISLESMLQSRHYSGQYKTYLKSIFG